MTDGDEKPTKPIIIPKATIFRSRPSGQAYPINAGPDPLQEALQRMTEKKCAVCGITSTLDPTLPFVDAPELGGQVCKRCLDKRVTDDAKKDNDKNYMPPEQPEKPEEVEKPKDMFDDFGRGIFD